MAARNQSKRDKALVERLATYRDEAVGSDAYREWRKSINVASAIRAGKQYPENITGVSESSSSEPYIALPYICDIGDRLVAMISGGRMKTEMVSRSRDHRALVEVFRQAHVAMQQQANLRGYQHQAVADCVWTGQGWTRWYLQRDPVFSVVPRVESIFPGQTWISPYSRNPYDRLLGSPYWGYETLETRSRLMLRYPASAKAIAELDGEHGPTDTDDADPIANLAAGAPEGAQYTNWAMGRGFSKSDHSYFRVIELIYQDTDADPIMSDIDAMMDEDTGAIIEPEVRWRVAHFVVPGVHDEAEAAIVVHDAEIPYSGPNVCGFSSWLNPDAAWSAGALSRGFDAQFSLDVLMSILISSASKATRISNVIIEKAGQFVDPAQREAMRNGEVPLMISVEGEPNIPLSHLIGQLQGEMPNFAEFQSLVMMQLNLIERLTGVSNIARGDVSPSQRISTKGLQSLISASLSAQDIPQMHVNAAITHNGRILQEMMQYHMVGPFNLSEIGGGGPEVDVNQALPIEMIDLLDGMLQSDPQGSGMVNIPNAVRVFDDQGDAEDIPMDFSDPEVAIPEIEAIVADETTMGVDIIINDVSILNVIVHMEVDSEYQEEHNDLMQRAQMYTAGDPSRLSRQTQFEIMFDGKNQMDWETEERRLLGDQVAQKLNMISMLPPEQQQQIDAVLAQVIGQMQQGAPGGQGAAGPPQPGPPNPVPAAQR